MTLFNEKVKGYIAHSVYAVAAIFVFFLQSSGLATFKLFGIYPQLLVAFTILAGFFFREYSGAAYGLIFGLLLDSVTTGLFGFNTVVLSFIGFVSGMTMTYMFNNNFVSAMANDVIFTFFYFLMKWLFFSVFKGDSPRFFFWQNFLSFVYTAVLGLLIFAIFRLIFSRLNSARR